MPYIEYQGKRLLFIHIPRTGGTSIERAMKEVAGICLCSRAIPAAMKTPPEHFTWSDIAALFPARYFDYSFTVIRCPYHRIESEYRMRSILSTQGLWGATAPFSIWLANSIHQARRDSHFLASHFRPQTDFLGSGVRVFRYEDGLDNIVARVEAESGIRLTLPQQRALSSGAFEKVIDWDAQDIHLVNQHFRADFEELGYEQRTPGFGLA